MKTNYIHFYLLFCLNIICSCYEQSHLGNKTFSYQWGHSEPEKWHVLTTLIHLVGSRGETGNMSPNSHPFWWPQAVSENLPQGCKTLWNSLLKMKHQRTTISTSGQAFFITEISIENQCVFENIFTYGWGRFRNQWLKKISDCRVTFSEQNLCFGFFSISPVFGVC